MDARVSLTQASNGEDNILCQGRSLYSRYAPSASSLKAALQAPLKEQCLYIIPSPLLGYGIFSFISRMPSTSLVIGIEIDQDLMAITALHQQRILEQEPRYQSYRIESSGQLYELFRRVQQGHYRHCTLLPLNGGYSLNKIRYDALFSTVQHFMKNYWQNRLTMARMGPLWIKNLFDNFGFLDQMDIKDFHTGKPVLLAGAGESLEKSIPHIEEHRDSLYLLCVDTALQVLVRNGIIPDGVVNLEAQFYNLKDFYSLQNHRIDIFSDITAYPPTLRQNKCRHYIFSSSFEETALHCRLRAAELLPREIPPLGSVGVAALYLAGEITDSKVFITGLDFSYREGKTHACETPFHDWCRLKEGRLNGDVWYSFSKSRPSYSAQGKVSGFVTNSILESYGRQLEDLSTTMENRVYDLAETGLKMSIPGINGEELGRMIKSEDQEYTGRCDIHDNDKSLRLSQFRESEKKRLKDLISLWDDVIHSNKKEEEILPLIAECDYLYFHFPDRNMLPNTDPAFLFRVIREARNILRRLS